MKRNIYILLGVVLLIGVALAQNADSGIAAVFKQEEPLPTETGPRAGLLAPGFSLKGMDGKPIPQVERRKRLYLSASGLPGVNPARRKRQRLAPWLLNIKMKWICME